MPRSDRKPSPLSDTKLEELALAYVARFATTRSKLEGYLSRKLRERGWEGDALPDAAGLAQRFAEAGYVDDAVYAKMKSESLLRRGYGGRRVGEVLRAAGVEEALRQDVAPVAAEARRAAFALARRRRFGPFADPLPDRPQRDKQIGAMLRAGHTLDNARQIVEAADLATVQEWVESALPGECDDRDFGDGEFGGDGMCE